MYARESPTASKILIAKNVKLLRRYARLSQVSLAKQAGVSQATVSNLENPDKAGDNYSPTTDNIDAIAAVFGLPGAVLAMNLPMDILLNFSNISSVIHRYVLANSRERQAIEAVAELTRHNYNATA